MPITATVVIKTLHVLAATVVVGYYALLPMWKASAVRAGDAAVLRHFFSSTRDLERRLAIPAAALMLATGLGLALGPYKMVDLVTSRWAQASLLLAIILLILLGSLAGPAKKMSALAQAGETTGPAMDKLWGEWRASLLAGAAISVIALVTMVYQSF